MRLYIYSIEYPYWLEFDSSEICGGIREGFCCKRYALSKVLDRKSIVVESDNTITHVCGKSNDEYYAAVDGECDIVVIQQYSTDGVNDHRISLSKHACVNSIIKMVEDSLPEAIFFVSSFSSNFWFHNLSFISNRFFTRKNLPLSLRGVDCFFNCQGIELSSEEIIDELINDIIMEWSISDNMKKLIKRLVSEYDIYSTRRKREVF